MGDFCADSSNSVGSCASLYAYLDNEHTIIVPDSKPQNMGPYEMETIILWELGYNVSGR
jgi:hypothetical protein